MKKYAPAPVGNDPFVTQLNNQYEAFRASKLPLVMLVLNLCGATAHGIGVILTRTQARLDFELRIWQELLINSGNTSQPSWSFEKDFTHINPSTVITAFFGLSLAFHLGISFFLVLQRYQPDAWYTDWYMRGLYDNVAWWRWLEYFFSAPLMLLLSAPLMGIREIYAIWAVVGSLAVTMVFGWITEIHAMHFIDELSTEKSYAFGSWNLTRRWRHGSWKTRLQIHVLGYLPYGLCWAIVFDRFRRNMQALTGVVPDFVNGMVIGSFALFTLFGITQLLHQTLPFGPSVYWLGEIIYVVLSFVAKAQLGFVVLYQALVEEALFDNQLRLGRLVSG